MFRRRIFIYLEAPVDSKPYAVEKMPCANIVDQQGENSLLHLNSWIVCIPTTGTRSTDPDALIFGYYTPKVLM